MGNFSDDEIEMLSESNAIEGVYSKSALADAKHAWAYARKFIKPGKDMTCEDVLEIHRLLMVKLNPRIAGSFRTCAVYVGSHIAPAESERALEARINADVLYYLNEEGLKHSQGWSEIEKITHTRHAHVRFEKIHPHEDGNGRTGRILYNVHRLKLGLELDIIYANDRQDYYAWFR